jgi:hypothetical protein
LETTADYKEHLSSEQLTDKEKVTISDINAWVMQRLQYNDYSIVNRWLQDIQVADPRNSSAKLIAIYKAATTFNPAEIPYKLYFCKQVEKELRRRGDSHLLEGQNG